MNTISRMLIVAGAITLASAPRAWSAEAQVPDSPLVAIKIQHVAPSTMARWLAPIKTFNPTTMQVETVGESLFDTVLPNDVSHELWARATSAQEARLRQAVKTLDVEPQRVQIEVQAARVATPDLASMLTLLRPNAGAKPEMAILPPPFVWSENYQATLQSLVAQKHAVLLLRQTFAATDRRPSILDAQEPPETANRLQGEVTPIVGEDSTIAFKLWLQGGAQEEQARNRYTFVNARDGATAALVLPDADATSPESTVVFITARLPRPTAAI